MISEISLNILNIINLFMNDTLIVNYKSRNLSPLPNKCSKIRADSSKLNLSKIYNCKTFNLFSFEIDIIGMLKHFIIQKRNLPYYK
jgi:hypothetical protein